MAMSRRDYVAFAEVIAAEVTLAKHADQPEVIAALRNLTLSLADVLKRDNSRFDRDRFYAAAGIERYTR